MTAQPRTTPAAVERAASVYADRTAIVDGDRRWSYAEFSDRCLRQAGLLAGLVDLAKAIVAGHPVTAEELRQHVRGRLAAFKVPDRVEFGALPKTASGKIREFELRNAEWGGHRRIGAVGENPGSPFTPIAAF